MQNTPVPSRASLPSKLAWPGFLQLLASLWGNLLQADTMVAGPWLQIRWFGNGLVEAKSAHKPVRVLNTLALQLRAASTLHLEALVQSAKNPNSAHVNVDAAPTEAASV